VMATPAAPATRLAAAMVMDTPVGTEKPPLGTPADNELVSVFTVMPVVDPTVAAEPMLVPVYVTVTAAPAAMPLVLVNLRRLRPVFPFAAKVPVPLSP
jgi:hypothetical protein